MFASALSWNSPWNRDSWSDRGPWNHRHGSHHGYGRMQSPWQNDTRCEPAPYHRPAPSPYRSAEAQTWAGIGAIFAGILMLADS